MTRSGGTEHGGREGAGRRPASIGLDAPRLTRRSVLRSLGLGTGALAVSSLASLVACEPDEPPVDRARPAPSASEPPVDWEAWWAEQEITGTLTFANWPYSIDRGRGGGHPSIDLFTTETGIEVDYQPTIQGNAQFLDLIRPALEAGDPTGYDLIVITNGPELAELIGSDWLTPLDHSHLPHVAQNAGPHVRDPIWDPGNRYSLAWQSGLTGIAYAPEAVERLGREPTSIQDLWNPELAGRVGMMSDPVELGSAGLLAIGVDPTTSTVDDWRAAADRLRAQQDAVEPRYYAQGYVDALSRGDTAISLAWSSDIFQLTHLGDSPLRFVVPDEGAMFWTDNLLIPRGAEHPLDALTYMDFVYRTRVAAMIADWVWRICPVPAARSIVARELDDPDVARSPLVFPRSGILGDGGDASGSRLRNYYVYADAADYAAWTSVFQPIVFS